MDQETAEWYEYKDSLHRESESQSEILVDTRLRRDEIIPLIQAYCADLHEKGDEWTPDDGAYIASLLNKDAEDDPWGFFRFIDERTGDWRVGYTTKDGREWFHILRQMRNTVGSGLFENLRRS
jgi:hypothetical protein